jgi:cobalt-zinc-cadmium resistance protein CzcA
MALPLPKIILITVAIGFFYTAFNSIKKALLVLMNVPFGLMGGIVALIFSQIYLSVSTVI